jgi:steroid delta-isomerase-like uncharacterized protein
MTSEVFENNKKLIYRFTEECWNGGNLDAVPEMIAEHCQYHDAVFPHMIEGVASMQRHIERCRRAFPDLKFTITETVARGNEVEVRWSATATQAAEFLSMPAMDKSASIQGTSIYRIEDGKIVENWVTWNLMSLMEQLGVGTAAGQM